MRNFPTNILLLIICCLWCHVQSTAGVNYKKCRLARYRCTTFQGDNFRRCVSHAVHACLGASGKRSDINDLGQSTDLRAVAEGPEIQRARRGEVRKGGGKESAASRDDRETDDLRSEISDLRQLLEEKELLDIANRQLNSGPVPLDSTLGQLKPLLKKSAPQVEDREEEDEDAEAADEEEPPGQNSTNTDNRYSIRYTLTMLGKILDDIESKLNSQEVSESVSKTRGHADDAENDF